MSVTIIDVLRNAEHNLGTTQRFTLLIAKEQLHNAIILLDKGYDLYDDYTAIEQEHGSAEKAPDKE